MSKPSQSRYSPITPLALDALALLEGFNPPTWEGPALPYPHDLEEVLYILNRLVARLAYLVQADDALSMVYTIGSVTATAERFLLGPEYIVQSSGALREALTVVEMILKKLFSSTEEVARIQQAFAAIHTTRGQIITHATLSKKSVPDDADLSTLSLTEPKQFAMTWTTFHDVYRNAYPRLDEFAHLLESPDAATKSFWPLLSSTALPYNLLVLQKITTPETAAPFQEVFAANWDKEYAPLMKQGLLYGIDMAEFTGIAPHNVGKTVRFTPNTRTLLAYNPVDKSLTPIAIYVADPAPQTQQPPQVYTPASNAWNYALIAAKTSLTVHGIWIGHVYIQHIITAAMIMALFGIGPDDQPIFPKDHQIFRMLAPQAKYVIPFDLLLLLGWSALAPPTSIGDTGAFLAVANAYGQRFDFTDTEPKATLKRQNLDSADFTAKTSWDLYPNVVRTLRIWNVTETYVSAVVDDYYTDDTKVADDTCLQNWIAYAGRPDGGNVRGIPTVSTKKELKAVLTSVLFRIHFHGIGRLPFTANPVPSFVPNYPPCLQRTDIPAPGTVISVQELLTYLPKTGTLGAMVNFYMIFGVTEPFEPLVPYQGPEAELFYASDHPKSNAALVELRQNIASMIKEYQPDYANIGQWPLNIEQ